MSFGTKFKEVFLKIWKDPVWSKVIAAGILALIAVVVAKLTNHTWTDIYYYIISFLLIKLPLYLFLSAIALYFIVKKCIQLFKNRKDPFWDEQFGNYTFKDLYNILLTTSLPVQTMGMKISGRSAPTDDWLLLFQVYYVHLNKGIHLGDNIQDGGYLYGVFAPRMVGYGLVDEFQKSDDNVPGVTDAAYKTSALGHRFHAALDKLILADKLKELRKGKKDNSKK